MDDFGKVLLYIIVFSLIIAASYLYSLYQQMNNVKPQGGATDYMIKDSFELSQKSDRYMYGHTTCVKIQTNNKK